MAKRKTEPANDQPEYEDVEPIVEDEPASAQGLIEALLDAPLVIDGEPTQAVTFQLPRAVLYALIDPAFEEADVKRAARYGLLGAAVGELTPIGQLVLAGTDRTALMHKINAGWRNKHNAEIDRG